MRQTFTIRYFAILRDQAGKDEESYQTSAKTPGELFTELADKYSFSLGIDQMKVAVNDTFENWDKVLNEDDLIVFIPPVAGG